MKISIVNPNLSGDISILEIGITYLATYINQKTAHKASTIDFTFNRKNWRKYLQKQIQEKKPDVLGISATSLYMNYCRDIINEAKKIKPSLKIIMGGWHCSIAPEDSINNYQFVEAIILGDGEYPLASYLDALEKKTQLDGIEGLWFRDSDGKIIKNKPNQFIQNIDTLPVPDYDIWDDLEKYFFYNQMLYFIGNRGCPYGCTYCTEAAIKKVIPGNNIRKRNPRLLANEVLFQYNKYKKRGFRIAHFFDPVFPFNEGWVKEFTDEYIKIGLAAQLPFSCFTRIDTIDENRIKMMAAANCKILRIGIEAGNEYIRNTIYKKNISNDEYRRIIGLAHKYGISITGYNLIGGPDESKETLNETFDFINELKVERPIFFTYRPLPETEGAKQIIEYGGKISGWGEIDSLHKKSNISSSKLSSGYIMYFRYKCLIYYTLKRTFKLLKKQKLVFIINFLSFLLRGLKDGVGLEYVIGYFYVCAGDNLIE